ncbi:TPA: fimbria/pilus periplasmic chaperone [Escherichia coli]|uniref:fimbria/pilus periplasmic chaperone n=1 Tax=Escherichia coli TaxID=562 RepID=UPI00179707C3|nr:fimbria/pilus periplasmic chaperone [Escherichia coli]EEV9791357.1 fimbria/pilus periplasmic chaperone [Escherichia coli]EEW1328338.1 fimbria/pilus periplasmic chaperone [Escherichia coli]EEY7371164.1 fimbria/pilus periplasmic chaperone [Escherichia coli]EFH6666291.1 fimbria/pilus periplasmic chaperone [Escherichia coli]
MRVLLSSLVAFLTLIIPTSVDANVQELGVAVDPLKIKVEPNHMVYFTVSNDTENDYIVTAKTTSTLTIRDAPEKEFFLVNPPIRLLKKRSRAQMGVVYLPDRHHTSPGSKYYLSISFIPKIAKDTKLAHIPIILVQQVPLVIK